MSQTIRQHAEWLAAGADDGALFKWTAEAQKRGQAILDALDAAEFTKSGVSLYAINPQTGYRLIPDPDPHA